MGGRTAQETARIVVSRVFNGLTEGTVDTVLQAEVETQLRREGFGFWHEDGPLVYFGNDTKYDMPHSPTGSMLEAGDLVVIDVTPIRGNPQSFLDVEKDLGDFCATMVFDSPFNIFPEYIQAKKSFDDYMSHVFVNRGGKYMIDSKVPDDTSFKELATKLDDLTGDEYFSLKLVLAHFSERMGENLRGKFSRFEKGTGRATGSSFYNEVIDLLTQPLPFEGYSDYRFSLFSSLGEVGHIITGDIAKYECRELLSSTNKKPILNGTLWAIGPPIGLERNINGEYEALPFAAKSEDIVLYQG